METASRKESLTVLRRLTSYAEKVFHLSLAVITPLVDRRAQPRIPTAVVVKAAVGLFWARLGSLNAWAQLAPSPFWKKWLGEAPCSADSMGRIHALLDADGLRQGLHHLYGELKRNKALPDRHGWGVAVLDGHESHASYRRCCSGCLQRTIHSEAGDRTQYYHRQVVLMLLPDAPPGRPPVRLLLDLEPQQPGEDEVTTALRLVERVLRVYPRAFDLLLADGLYAQARFFNCLLARHKHALAVLKDERRNLYQDVAGLIPQVTPQEGEYRSRQCQWWDFPDLVTWPEVNGSVRVIRSLETHSVRRQLDKKQETLTSDWIWVTTLPSPQVLVEPIVEFGHLRWDIENYAFQELAQEWHCDHVFRHEANAIECFLLVAFLAYNLFHAFFALNLKPAARKNKAQNFCAKLLAVELYQEVIPASLSP